MTGEDRELGALREAVEHHKRGERDLWDALRERDTTIGDLKDRLTKIETEKSFAGLIARGIWSVAGALLLWLAQHFGLPAPKP